MKILVILASGIGNSILFGPTLTALRNRFPDGRIDVFARPLSFAEPFTGGDLVSNVIGYEGPGTLLKLRKERYDVSITAFPSNRWQFNVFASVVGARRRITHSYKVGGLRTLSFLQNERVPADESLHDIEQNLGLLGPLGVEPPERAEPVFLTSTANEERADRFLAERQISGRHLVGVHPGCGPLVYKRAPLTEFVERIERSVTDGSVVLVFGGPEETESQEELRSALDIEAHNVSMELKDAAALIRKCAVFVTNDTGLMHIASTSARTKVVALFNGTNPTRTAPRTSNAEVILLKGNMLLYPFRSIDPNRLLEGELES